VDPEYLTTAEVAALLRLAPKTIRNKVAAGVFRQGEHFFRKPGLGPRWKRETIIRWLENDETQAPETFLLAQPGSNKMPWLTKRSLASCAERNERPMPDGDRAA
jgi:hypothetical protein